MLEKLSTWFLFSVVLALVPLGATALVQASRKPPNSFAELIAQGELLLVAASLCAAATADLFTSSGGRWRMAKLWAGGATVVILLFSAIYYASVVSAQKSGAAFDVPVVYQTSLVLFISAFCSSGACAALSKV